MSQYFLTSLIILFASFTFSFAGFGFGMIAVPLLALFMETRHAVLFQYPYALVIVLFLAVRARKYIAWKEIWSPVVGATLGLPSGFFFSQSFPDHILKKILGFFIGVFVIVSLFPLDRVFQKFHITSKGWGVIFGLIGGVFQGAYNTGGPPVVIYSLAANEDKEKRKGVISYIIAYMLLFLLIPYGLTGSLTVSGLIYNIYYLPVVLVGIWSGDLLFEKIDHRFYRRSVLLLLLVAASLLWILN